MLWNAPPIDALVAASDMIPHFEGFRSKPYWDAYGKCWSIGYGFCTMLDGSIVGPHTPALTLGQCQALLAHKLETDYMPDVMRRLKGCDLTTLQLAALTSFAWNLGGGRITTSGLPSLLLAHDYIGASKAMQAFVYAGGVKLGGLVTRRAEEGAVVRGASWPITALPDKVINVKRNAAVTSVQPGVDTLYSDQAGADALMNDPRYNPWVP